MRENDFIKQALSAGTPQSPAERLLWYYAIPFLWLMLAILLNVIFVHEASVAPPILLAGMAIFSFRLSRNSMAAWVAIYVIATFWILYLDPDMPSRHFALVRAVIRAVSVMIGGIAALIIVGMRMQFRDRLTEMLTILQDVPLPVVISDESGFLVFVNSAATRMLDIPAGEILGHPYFALLSSLTDKGRTIERYLSLVDRPNPAPEVVYLTMRHAPERLLLGSLIPIGSLKNRRIVTIVRHTMEIGRHQTAPMLGALPAPTDRLTASLLSRLDPAPGILVLAHVPPPHHGQSFMVQLALNALNERSRAVLPTPFRIAHVNCTVSKQLQDIGVLSFIKTLRLLFFCFQALWKRFFLDMSVLYYVPAPGKRVTVYRDWIVMAICRPFFKRLVLHWHATGLGEWIEKEATPIERWITRRLLDGADVSIVLTEFNRDDAAKLNPKRMEVLPNGIPDPCPDFAESVAVERKQSRADRLAAIATNPASRPEFHFLFLSNCQREKGLFDALDAMEILLRLDLPWQPKLRVAGSFLTPAEEREFHNRCQAPDLKAAVQYEGFVQGTEKKRLFTKADAFVFPSHWDNCPVALVEAFAFDLPVIATRTNGVPTLFPKDYPYLIETGNPQQLAEQMERVLRNPPEIQLRRHFLANFGLDRFISLLEGCILGK